MKRILCSALGLLLFSLAGDSMPSKAAMDLTGVKQSLGTADADFGIALYKRLAAAKPKDNVVISPLSVATCLQMAANGAAGETRKEMEQALSLAKSGLSLDDANKGNQDILKSLASLPAKQILEIANALFVQNNFALNKPVVDLLNRFYEATAQNVDFGQSSAVTTVNNWVATKTHGKIASLLDSPNSALRLVLVNAVYFKGAWDEPFAKKDTAQKPFHAESGDKQVPMMSRAGKMDYFESDDVQAVSLPYSGNRMRMVVLLPKAGKLPAFESSLSDQSFAMMTNRMEKRPGKLKLPRFKVQWSQTLNDSLKALGMKEAFTSQADFSKLSRNQLFISEVIHKTYMDVNEEGTEAAAITGTMMCGSAMPAKPPQPFEMTVDRPFFIVIEDRDTNAMLFLGKIMSP